MVRRPDGRRRARLRGAVGRRVGVVGGARARGAHAAARRVPARRRRGRRPRLAPGGDGRRRPRPGRQPGRHRGAAARRRRARVEPGRAGGRHGRGDGLLQPRLDRPAAGDRPAAQLQQANGLRATAMSAGEILGPVLAGVLVAAAGAGWAIAVDAATFAGSAAFLAGLRALPVAPRAPTSFWHELRDGWGAFRARTWVWSFVACAALEQRRLGGVEHAGPGRRRPRPRGRRGVGHDPGRDGRRRAGGQRSSRSARTRPGRCSSRASSACSWPCRWRRSRRARPRPSSR